MKKQTDIIEIDLGDSPLADRLQRCVTVGDTPEEFEDYLYDARTGMRYELDGINQHSSTFMNPEAGPLYIHPGTKRLKHTWDIETEIAAIAAEWDIP